MDDIPQIYQMETVEQLRTVADRLRVRIFEALSRQPMTVAHLSAQLGLAHAKVHYHVRELERVGLVRLVETREKGGILEKYYRSVARDLALSPTLLHGMPPDEGVGVFASLLQEITQGFTRTFARRLRTEGRGEPPTDLIAAIDATTLFLSAQEAAALDRQILALLAPFRAPRGGAEEREFSFVRLLYTEPPPSDEDDTPPRERPAAPARPAWPAAPAAPAPVRGRLHRSLSVGAAQYARADLERLAERGERLDVYALGSCAFADDIPAALVDRVIGRFRLRGRLDAAPEVRAVLERKEKGG